jgi:hypothetical protein
MGNSTITPAGRVRLYLRLVGAEVRTTYLAGLLSPVMGLVLLAVAYLLARALFPGEWIGPSFWEDFQKAALILLIYAALSFVASLMRAPYTIHQRQEAMIASLQAVPAPAVSPLQQTFNFFVTTPEQAAQVATNVMTATAAPAATGVGEAGEGGETTTTDQAQAGDADV